MLQGFTSSMSLSLLWDTWETLLWQYLWEQWHSATCWVLVLLSLMPSRERDRMGAVNKKTGRHALLITRSHFRSIQWNAEESCRNVHLTRRWHGAWVMSHKTKMIVWWFLTSGSPPITTTGSPGCTPTSRSAPMSCSSHSSTLRPWRCQSLLKSWVYFKIWNLLTIQQWLFSCHEM